MKFKEIKVVNIEDIKPYPKNTKKHPQTQIDKLIKQLAQGFDQPIVVDKNFVIIKGHARHTASLQMGLKKVPVIIRDDLTDEQVKAVRIADNKIAESEWEIDILVEELKELQENINLQDLGFDSDELEKLLGDITDDDYDISDDFDDDGNVKSSSTKEIDTDGFEFEHTCPKCGFSFN